MTFAAANISEAQLLENTFKLDVYAGGTRALYTGDISYGSVEAIQDVLNAHSNVQMLGFSSLGGNINVGRNIFFLIRERGLSTFVSEKCSSSCTLAFMGGQQRLLGAEAAIGFHADDGGGGWPHFDGRGSFLARARPLGKVAGVDPAFIDYAYSTDSSDLFVPSAEKLIQNGFATGHLVDFDIREPIEASYTFVADPFQFAAEALRERRWDDAADHLEEAIKTGVAFPLAHFTLGYLYDHGLGVSQDYARAAELYGAASVGGDAQAAHNLGLMLVHGKGVERDLERGVMLVRRAADAGDVYAKFNLARWYTDGRYGQRDIAKAFLLLSECANAGYFECQLELANRYSVGGTPLDLEKARHWYSEALRHMPKSYPNKDAARERLDWIDRQLKR